MSGIKSLRRLIENREDGASVNFFDDDVHSLEDFDENVGELQYVKLFGQGRFWFNGYREKIKLSDLEDNHIVNIVCYLERNVEKYKAVFDLEISSLTVVFKTMDKIVGYETVEPLLNVLFDMDALEWLSRTPLFQALKIEIDVRGLVGYLERLRKIGRRGF